MSRSFTVNAADGATLCGHEQEGGRPLLLLHGGPGVSDYMDLLGSETAGWHTITYQQRGLAPSGTDGPFTVAQHVADTVAVLDGLGIERAVLLGHSWGCHLALQVAVAHPKRVAGLVLIDPPGPTGDGGLVEMAEELERRLPAADAARAEAIATRLTGRQPSDADATETLALRWPGYFADPSAAPPLPADFRVSLIGNAETVGSLFEALNGDFAPSLRRLGLPAVFVLGAESPLSPRNGQQAAALMPDAEVDVVAGAGHLPWVEAPGCVSAALARLESRLQPREPTDGDAYLGDPAVQAEWDRRYADRDQLWSGQPNGALVAEVAGLKPGRVLDVGCGEGADAVWLARRGWDVTALEVSGVALERAAGHARDAGVAIRWVHAELAEAVLPPASFDLVSAQYPALLRTPDGASERALLTAVAPGGVLLLVHHAGMHTQPVHEGGFDPADYVWLTMVAARLDDDWEVEVDEQRPRLAPESGAGARPVDDVVLRARRLR